MDTEASAGRVLSARHIADKSVPAILSNTINTTLLCRPPEERPRFSQYSEALQLYGPVLWTCGFLAVVISCLLFVLTLRAVRVHRPEIFKHAVFVLAVYPIVTMSAYLATWVPRARLLSEAVAQESAMVAMYHLVGLLLAECGGIDQFVRRSNGARLETRVLPCCCWPCCHIPRLEMKRSNLDTVRYLVLQMPVVQALIYVIFLVMWLEDEDLYEKNAIWIQPFVTASILLGMWGVIMTIRAVEVVTTGCRAKFLVLQLALVVLKLQCGVAKLLSNYITLPCYIPLHPMIFMTLLHNLATMLQMILLSLWARRIYSTPPQKRIDKVVVSPVPEADKARTPEISYQGTEKKY